MPTQAEFITQMLEWPSVFQQCWFQYYQSVSRPIDVTSTRLINKNNINDKLTSMHDGLARQVHEYWWQRHISQSD